jgi:putative transcriptional regulator
MRTAQEIKELREKLGMSQVEFARSVGADARSVSRWESGTAKPSGSSLEVMNAIDATFKRNQDRASDVAGIVFGAMAVGGLGFLIVSLLEQALSKTPRGGKGGTKL